MTRQEDAWVIVNGDALDVTKWIPIHPGGEQVGTPWFFSCRGWFCRDFPWVFQGFSKILGKICCKILLDLGQRPWFLWDFSLLKSIHWRFRVKIDVDCRQADMGVNLLKPLEMLQAIMAYLGKDATEEWVMIHKPGRLGVGWSKWPWQHINGHFRNRFIGGTYHI